MVITDVTILLIRTIRRRRSSSIHSLTSDIIPNLQNNNSSSSIGQEGRPFPQENLCILEQKKPRWQIHCRRFLPATATIGVRKKNILLKIVVKTGR